MGEDELRAQVLRGGYRLREPSLEEAPLVVLAAAGPILPEVLLAADELEAEGVASCVINITSVDRLYQEWRAAGDARRADFERDTGRDTGADNCCAGPTTRAARTVLDGSAHALAFLGAVFGQVTVPLGMDQFGQSGERVRFVQVRRYRCRTHNSTRLVSRSTAHPPPPPPPPIRVYERVDTARRTAAMMWSTLGRAWGRTLPLGMLMGAAPRRTAAERRALGQVSAMAATISAPMPAGDPRLVDRDQVTGALDGLQNAGRVQRLEATQVEHFDVDVVGGKFVGGAQGKRDHGADRDQRGVATGAVSRASPIGTRVVGRRDAEAWRVRQRHRLDEEHWIVVADRGQHEAAGVGGRAGHDHFEPGHVGEPD